MLFSPPFCSHDCHMTEWYHNQIIPWWWKINMWYDPLAYTLREWNHKNFKSVVFSLFAWSTVAMLWGAGQWPRLRMPSHLLVSDLRCLSGRLYEHDSHMWHTYTWDTEYRCSRCIRRHSCNRISLSTTHIHVSFCLTFSSCVHTSNWIRIIARSIPFTANPATVQSRFNLDSVNPPHDMDWIAIHPQLVQ